MTFLTQLIWFQQRLGVGPENPLPIKAKVYLLSSFQPEDPFKISCRLLMDNLYNFNQAPKVKKLDPRGAYVIIQEGLDKILIWVGKEASKGSAQRYVAYAKEYILNL